MASVFYSDQYYKPTPGIGSGGDLKVLIGSYTFSSITIIGDVVHMFVIPAGFTPLFGRLVGDDLDTGIEALEIDVGIVGDSTKYLDSGVITGDTVAGGDHITVGISLALQEDLMTVTPTQVTTDVDCIATITAAAVGTGTGTITVYLCGVMNDPRIVA